MMKGEEVCSTGIHLKESIEAPAHLAVRMLKENEMKWGVSSLPGSYHPLFLNDSLLYSSVYRHDDPTPKQFSKLCQSPSLLCMVLVLFTNDHKPLEKPSRHLPIVQIRQPTSHALQSSEILAEQ